MRGGDGSRAAREIREALPRTRALAPCAHVDRSSVLEMLGAGAVGYLAKDDGPGLTPSAARSRPAHVGLAALRGRAELAGGWLRIDSAPNDGIVEFWTPSDAAARITAGLERVT